MIADPHGLPSHHRAKSCQGDPQPNNSRTGLGYRTTPLLVRLHGVGMSCRVRGLVTGVSRMHLDTSTRD
ncbi:hypothetical protein J7546_27150, partial [Escherichia coli]|uniref:hypothetical protein n=1 Tax=Escherichia coli TaxID=562 RepID=UPI001AEB282B